MRYRIKKDGKYLSARLNTSTFVNEIVWVAAEAMAYTYETASSAQAVVDAHAPGATVESYERNQI
jgi:hypothetical protein